MTQFKGCYTCIPIYRDKCSSVFVTDVVDSFSTVAKILSRISPLSLTKTKDERPFLPLSGAWFTETFENNLYWANFIGTFLLILWHVKAKFLKISLTSLNMRYARVILRCRNWWEVENDKFWPKLFDLTRHQEELFDLKTGPFINKGQDKNLRLSNLFDKRNTSVPNVTKGRIQVLHKNVQVG